MTKDKQTTVQDFNSELSEFVSKHAGVEVATLADETIPAGLTKPIPEFKLNGLGNLNEFFIIQKSFLDLKYY